MYYFFEVGYYDMGGFHEFKITGIDGKKSFLSRLKFTLAEVSYSEAYKFASEQKARSVLRYMVKHKKHLKKENMTLYSIRLVRCMRNSRCEEIADYRGFKV